MSEQITLAGVECIAAGSLAAPATVLLHAGDIHVWDDLIPLLSMHARVLAPVPASMAPDEIRGILAAEGHDHAAVVAGGAAAHAAYALAADGMATALVLIAAEPPVDPEPLRVLDIPVFLIWGEDDEVVPVAVGEALTDVFGGATLAVVPDSGNDVLTVDAPTVVPLIKEYLKVRAFGGGHAHDDGPVPVMVSLTRPERPEHFDG